MDVFVRVRSPTPTNQHGLPRVVDESRNSHGLASEHRLDSPRGVVAATKPDDLWRSAPDDGDLVEIAIGGDDYKIVGSREFPDFGIRCLRKPGVRSVHRARVQVAETGDEFAGQVPAEEKFHNATRRPRRAA